MSISIAAQNSSSKFTEVHDPADFATSIQKIKKRLGGERYQRAMAAVDRQDALEIARIALQYYDKGYEKATKKWTHHTVTPVKLPLAGDVRCLDELRRIGHEMIAGKPVATI